MIAIIAKAEVAAESIWILLRATCQVDFAFAALKVACHHLACLVHALCMPSCVLLMAYAWL